MVVVVVNISDSSGPGCAVFGTTGERSSGGFVQHRHTSGVRYLITRHSTEAPGLVRLWLTSHLAERIRHDVVSDTVLMASELVTNAVRHGRPVTEVTLKISDTSICVGVADASPVVPTIQSVTSDEPHGRGLLIVDALATAWGVEPRGDRPGKTVWFTLDTATTRPQAEPNIR